MNKNSENKEKFYKEKHSNIIEEKNIKGGSGGPKLKKTNSKTWGVHGGVHGGHIQGVVQVEVQGAYVTIFSRFFCFLKSSAGKW